MLAKVSNPFHCHHLCDANNSGKMNGIKKIEKKARCVNTVT